VLADLGSLYNHLNEPEVALACHQQMLRVGQEVGAQTVVRAAWVRLGQDWEGLDKLAEARYAYQQALSLRCELEPNWTIEAIGGLARVALAQGDLTQAQQNAEDILICLETNTVDGACDIFSNYLACYRVLLASRDARAMAVLTTAHHLLQEQAKTLADEGWQRSFLENVPSHRQIITEYGKQMARIEVNG